MPHEGYADPVMNDGPGFHSNVPVSELTERVTRAIKASDISSAPPIVKTTDGVMHENSKPTPSEPNGAQGLGMPKHHGTTSATPRSMTLTRLIPWRTRRVDP